VADAGDDDMVGPRIRVRAALAGKDRDRGSTRLLGAAVRRGHDLAEPAGHHDAASFREETADLLRGRLVLATAPYHRHLDGHDCDPRHVAEKRDAKGGTLVVGGGFAGAYVARLLGKRGATVVNPDNFMLYPPLLAEAAAGTLEPRHVVVPIRQM
jgi:hypothetical protein